MPSTKIRKAYETKLPSSQFRLREPADRNTDLREIWQRWDADAAFHHEQLSPSTDADPGVVISQSKRQSDASDMELSEGVRKQTRHVINDDSFAPIGRIGRMFRSKSTNPLVPNKAWNTRDDPWSAPQIHDRFISVGAKQVRVVEPYFSKEGRLTGYVAIIHDATAGGASSIIPKYPEGRPFLKTGAQPWPFSPPAVLTPGIPEGSAATDVLANEIYQVVSEFAIGVGESIPHPDVVGMVGRIIKGVIEKTEEAEYSVDEDGALSFEAMLASGLFIMCEVSLRGHINAGLYRGPDGDLVEFLGRSTEEELSDLF